MLDNLGMPNEIEIGLMKVYETFSGKWEKIGIKDSDVVSKIDEYSYMLGTTSVRFVKDPITLDKLDFSKGKIQTPYIRNQTKFSKPIRNTDTQPLMDKIEFNQNIFIEIKDKDSDATIIPIEMNWDFLAHLR